MEPEFAPTSSALELHLESFDGPLYLLLDLARRQQVDLARISVAALAEQYVAAIANLDKIDIARAVDWLVMAAWLTWLKSRLLLPKTLPETQEAEQAAQMLTGRLATLERIRAVTAWLDTQPQLGRDVFARGRTDLPTVQPAAMDYLDLFEACLSVALQLQGQPVVQYRPPLPRTLWTAAHAMLRMREVLQQKPAGCDLIEILPKFPKQMPDREFHIRSALASTLIATLEFARNGEVLAEQDGIFAPIHVRPARIHLDL